MALHSGLGDSVQVIQGSITDFPSTAPVQLSTLLIWKSALAEGFQEPLGVQLAKLLRLTKKLDRGFLNLIGQP